MENYNTGREENGSTCKIDNDGISNFDNVICWKHFSYFYRQSYVTQHKVLIYSISFSLCKVAFWGGKLSGHLSFNVHLGMVVSVCFHFLLHNEKGQEILSDCPAYWWFLFYSIYFDSGVYILPEALIKNNWQCLALSPPTENSRTVSYYPIPPDGSHLSTMDTSLCPKVAVVQRFTVLISCFYQGWSVCLSVYLSACLLWIIVLIDCHDLF